MGIDRQGALSRLQTDEDPRRMRAALLMSGAPSSLPRGPPHAPFLSQQGSNSTPRDQLG